MGVLTKILTCKQKFSHDIDQKWSKDNSTDFYRSAGFSIPDRTGASSLSDDVSPLSNMTYDIAELQKHSKGTFIHSFHTDVHTLTISNHQKKDFM